MKNFFVFTNGIVIDISEIVGVFIIDDNVTNQLNEKGILVHSNMFAVVILNNQVVPVLLLDKELYKELVVYHLGFRNVIKDKVDEF